MNTKTLIAAAALATLPMTASAAVIEIVDGGTTMISGHIDDLFTFNVDPSAGGFSHTFELDGDGAGTAAVSLTTDIADLFTGLVAEWINVATSAVISTGTPVDLGNGFTGITAATTFTDPGSLKQILNISWKSVEAGAPEIDGQVRVSTVPVPAGLLLMGTALAGLGLTRRKKA